MVELGKVIFRCMFSVLGRFRRWTSTRDTAEGPPKATLSQGAQDTTLTCRQSGEEERGEERRGEERRGEERRGEERRGTQYSFETIAETTHFNNL